MPRIGIVTPYAANISPSGYYNRQDVGMAKALVELGHEVVLFKACDRRSAAAASPSLGPGIEEYALPSLVLGTHSLFRPSLLGSHRVDRFIVMSDVQIMVPTVFRWIARHGLPAFPYVGTLESYKGRSDPPYSWLLERNLRSYRRSICYAKTPTVLAQLQERGVTHAKLLPVCLDLTVMGDDRLGRSVAKESFGLPSDSKVLAFVGRLFPEKKPLVGAHVFHRLHEGDPRWSYLVIGSGPLEQELLKALTCATNPRRVVHIPRLPHQEMVRAYRASDVLINLNSKEIYGMTILESLFFGTPVVAVDAPGPRFIIREGLDGYIVPNEDPDTLAQAVLRAYEHRSSLGETSREGVLQRFDWKSNILRSGILQA